MDYQQRIYKESTGWSIWSVETPAAWIKDGLGRFQARSKITIHTYGGQKSQWRVAR